jgi:hypothetical protein
MLLLLTPSTTQQQALTAELGSLQDSTSPAYHQWFTPAAFASAYSNSAADVSAVSTWLQSQGLQVAPLPAGRGWIEFSGTVAQVEQAFQTQIDFVATSSGSRPVLVSDISVPAALRPLVNGLVSLDGTVSTPSLTTPQTLSVSATELAAKTSLNNIEALTPQLAARLVHFDALQSAGVDGKGQTIAIAARSNVNTTDVDAFRAAFALPSSPLQVLPNGSDPGLTSDQAQATQAASWAGAAAPGATVLLAPAATTNATDGVDLSLAAIIDQAMAHTVAVGYSACEAGLSPAHQAFYSALYRQAAAEGIAMIAATGDSGPSACHVAGNTAPVTTGYGVNALASTAWNTTVGAASFGVAGPAAGSTALSAWSPASPSDPAYAGGGGSSTLNAIPSWQPVPATLEGASATAVRFRLLPDLTLPTALDSAVNPGLAFCYSGSAPSNSCVLVRSGGSSAAAAVFAGIAALVAEKNGTQGNLAPGLYKLSRQSGVFNDVQQGSAQLKCVAGSSGCNSTEKIGFTAGTGYDMATGLGTVDAAALVNQWASPDVNGTNLATVTNTTAPSQTINPSGSVVLSATIASGSGSGAPTGTVAFYDQSSSSVVTTVFVVPGSGEVSTASVTVTGVLAQGGHPIVAQYSGDVTYAAANSQPVVVQAQPSSTVTVVTPATATPTPGSTLVVTAIVTSATAGSGALAPSGTVDFRVDGISQGARSVVAGVPASPSTNSTSSISITVPSTAGSHQIVGFYSGDSNYNNSTSVSAPITVAAGTPTVVLTPATTSPLPGSTLLLTATITPPSGGTTAATGSVNFTLDGTVVASMPVTTGSPSTASVTINTPAMGSHTLQAIYSGDGSYTTATSIAVTINVTKGATTLSVTPATTSPLGGATMLVTATVKATISGSIVPTGTVSFTMDGASIGSGTVQGGTTASVSITVPTAGTHTLGASYTGDTEFYNSVAPTANFTVRIPTTTIISPATTAPAGGSSLSVSTTITPSAIGTTLPTGTVTYTLDGTSVATSAVVSGSPATSSGTIPSIAPGVHTLQATYSGDAYYATSHSQSVTLTVSKSATSLTIIPSTLTPSAGGSLVVTANITSPSPAAAFPSGTVTISEDGVTVATGNVVAGSPSISTITIPMVAAGAHILEGTYSGDTYYTGSNSSTVSIVAAKGTTITTVAATPATLTAGTVESLTATVAPTNPVTGTVYTITGTVTFYDGTVLLGQVAVTSNTATLPGLSLKDNISHSITAVYSGDTNWVGSTSSALPLSATTLPDYVLLTSNYSTAQPGAAVVLTATVTPSSSPLTTGEANPTGLVVFYNGTTIIGEAALTPVALTDTSTATLTIQTLPGGQDTVSAYYQGDLYYDAATSNLLSLTIQAFTITPSSGNPATNLNIVQGSAGSTTFVITGEGGFNNEVQIVCAVPSQDNMTCTATPQEIVPPGNVTFVVQTYASGAPSTSTILSRRGEPMGPRAAGGAALALLLGFVLLPFGRRARVFLSARHFLIVLLLLAGLAGAGIGCTSSVATSANSTLATPLGVATLKITGTAHVDNAVVSQSVYLTVNVLTNGTTAQ